MRLTILRCLILLPLLFGCDDDSDEMAPNNTIPDPTEEVPDEPDLLEPTASCEVIGQLEFDQWVSDIWGYSENDENYVLIGFGAEGLINDTTGVYIVNVGDPTQPSLVKKFNNVGGWDIKTYQNYMYTVNGVEEAKGSVVDLSDPSNPVKVGEFDGAHNIFISNGLLTASLPGIKIYDIKTDPTNPRLLWTGGPLDSGHEAMIKGDTLFDFHGSEGTKIYDISDPTKPVAIGYIESLLIRFHHSGWVTKDGNYLVINDERPAGSAELGDDFTVWDISDIAQPVLKYKYKDLASTLHNVHIVNYTAYFSYYSAGLRAFDFRDPENPVLICEYDTDPEISGKGYFLGAFGVYALSDKPYVYISDVKNGLFIFDK
ncbi:LVIVD repeat-containing protein [Fulvivirga lutea]|uniref:Choice-of-anchor B family protein n=1 Tax=Fulvivirga lutea TaxID=2810512 RepID=A0A975A2C5_9BACT|nr:choice-of-anchor B family protein [Fulvivirga lutea]QSE99145.1 choice-of-anchor B family protein [Fulvivirga lutea]